MVDVSSPLPLFAVLVSLVAVPGIVYSKSPNIREGWTFAAAFAKVGLVIALAHLVLGGNRAVFHLVDVLPGAGITFVVDPMGAMFALVSSSLWIVTSAYSIGYMRGLREHAQTRYYCFFAIALSSTIGVAFSANLLTLYLFYELLSFATYPLVAHHQDAEAKSAGRRYLCYIVGGSVALLLPAMLWCYLKADTLDFVPGGILRATGLSGIELTILVCMFVFGFAKAAVMPLHAWLPAAMVAPTPVSALLHAVAVVKVGAFSVVRVLTGTVGLNLLTEGQLDSWILAVASITIIVASIIALFQDGLKRMLAYSTIGQLSYIVAGASLISPEGLEGALLHIATHALGKITLFFCAGAIFVATGKQRISEMNGIGRRMPLTMTAFLVASLSIIGVPPLAGFLSKWYLILGCVTSDRLWALGVFLLSSLLNAAYLIPVVYRAFFLPGCTGQEASERINEMGSWCTLAPLLTAGGCVGLIFFQKPLMVLAERASLMVWGG